VDCVPTNVLTKSTGWLCARAALAAIKANAKIDNFFIAL
jgi:hypothetical protein